MLSDRLRVQKGSVYYIAVAHDASPYFTLLEFDGSSIAKADDYTLPYEGWCVDTSADGSVIMVGCRSNGSDPEIFRFSHTDGVLTKEADYTFGYSIRGISMNADTDKIAVGHQLGKRFAVFNYDGSDISFYRDYQLPATATAVKYIPNAGTHVAVVCESSPYFYVLYERSFFGTITISKADDYTLAGSPRGLDVTSDGDFIAIAHQNGSGNEITVLSYSSGSVSHAGGFDFGSDSTNYGYEASFSPDGLYLATSQYKSPFMRLLDHDDGSLSSSSSYSSNGRPNSIAFSSDGKFLVAGYDSNDLTIFAYGDGTLAKVADYNISGITLNGIKFIGGH